MYNSPVPWSRFRETLVKTLERARADIFERTTDLRTQLVTLRTQQGWHAVWREQQSLVVFAAAYVGAWSYLFIAAFIGAKPPPAPLFLPGAVLLCTLILAPPHRWRVYLLAAFLIQVPILAYLRLPLWWNLVGFIPDAIEPVLAALLIRRYLRLPLRFATLREVSIYTACVAVAVAVAATLGAGVNAIGGQPYGSSWWTWFLSDTLAALILAPMLLLWFAVGVRGLYASSRWQYTELILLYGGLLVLGLTVFDTRLFDMVIADAEIYLPVPFLLWAAIRFGPRGLASALSLGVVLAIPAVANAMGPFASVSVPATALLANLYQLQLFLLMIGVPLFFLAALVEERKQADAAVRASEERFRNVVDAQTDLITRYLPDTTLTFVNHANRLTMGLSQEQLLGTKFVDLLPESAREPVLDTIQSLLEHPGVVTIEHQVYVADGSLRWEQWVNRTILDEEGRVTELQGIGRDITERREMEQALQASEARYRAAFESAVTGMMLVSIDGYPLQLNRPMVEMLGYTEEEARGRSFADFTYPDDMEPNLSLFRRAVAGEIDSYQLEKRFVHKQGHIVWGILSAGVVRDAAGNPLYLVGQLEDITARKRLEQEREEAHKEAERRAEELDRVFEAMADGVAVFDQDGWQLRSNAAYQRMLGLDTAPAAADYARRPLHERLALLEIRDEQGRPLPPEEGPLARALAGEVLAGAETVDLRVRTLDGREVELRVSTAPIRIPGGQLVGAVSIYQDVTEHKRLERALAEQAEQLDRIFEGIAEGLVVYDAKGSVMRTNAAARHILGLDLAPDEYAQVPTHGRAILYEAHDERGQRLAPEDWPLIRVLTGRVAGVDARDVRLRVLDDREVDIHTSAAPLRDGEGRLVGAVSILHDQTERRRLEREQEEARARELAVLEVNQRLDTFVTMAAHDLRSPVAVSRMVVQRAQQLLGQAAADTRSRSSKQPKMLANAALALTTTEANLDCLWRLVQQLLDVARVREGVLVLNRQPTDLAKLVQTCVEEQRLLNPSRVIEFGLADLADTPATDGIQSIVVDADADRLGQVVTNYLSNAERFSAEDQPIRVTLRLAEEATPDAGDAETDGPQMWKVARVQVLDQGVGIAKEDLVTIWNRFQQAASVHQASGLGLGLYIAQIVVELHGGQVGVESTPGQGSTFWFTVPLLDVSEPTVTIESSED